MGVGDADNPNGLGTPAVVDVDGDFIADFIYAGDLRGNVWRFDLKANFTPATYTFDKLFEAKNSQSSAESQAIVTKMEVGKNPLGSGTMIYFGTGTYFQESDANISNAIIESFYGIIDSNIGSIVNEVTRSELLQQTIDEELSGVEFNGPGAADDRTFNIRITSSNQYSALTPEKGWYMDLVSPVEGFQGERVVADAILGNGRILFTALIPSTSQCDSGGSGWVVSLNATDGSLPPEANLDFNNDGVINEKDLYVDGFGDKSAISGFQTEGIPRISIISGGDVNHIIVNDSSGNLSKIGTVGSGVEGRLS